jgi:hypothetical protein
MIIPKKVEDFLSFEEMAHNNILLCYTQKKRFKSLFEGINKLFYKLADYFELKPYSNSDYCPIFFVNRCHSAFLGAGRMAMSCQFQESQMLIRGIIENALYAFHVAQSPANGTLWLNRDSKKKEMKKSFQIVNIFDEIKTKDEKIYSILKKTYETSIDYGAHPNPFGWFMATKIKQTDENIHFNYEYLTSNNKAMNFLHIFLLDAGLQSLLLWERIYKNIFDETRISQMLKQLLSETDKYRKEQS